MYYVIYKLRARGHVIYVAAYMTRYILVVWLWNRVFFRLSEDETWKNVRYFIYEFLFMPMCRAWERVIKFDFFRNTQCPQNAIRDRRQWRAGSLLPEIWTGIFFTRGLRALLWHISLLFSCCAKKNFCNRSNSLSYDSRVRFRSFRSDLSRKKHVSFATFIKVELGQMHISLGCVKQCDTNPRRHSVARTCVPLFLPGNRSTARFPDCLHHTVEYYGAMWGFS